MSRIKHIASLIKDYQIVVDIGTDHGLVLKEAFDLGYIKSAIASDINQQPLLSAQKNLKGYPVKFIISDGFRMINEAFDAAIITGMGPYLIIDIMKNAPQDMHCEYILGANDKVHILRKWLVDNGFMIIDETVIYDGFYYQFIKVKRGVMRLSDKELHLGKYLSNKKDSNDFFVHQLKYYQDLLGKVPQDQKSKFQQIIKWYLKAINQSSD